MSNSVQINQSVIQGFMSLSMELPSSTSKDLCWTWENNPLYNIPLFLLFQPLISEFSLTVLLLSYISAKQLSSFTTSENPKAGVCLLLLPLCPFSGLEISLIVLDYPLPKH